MNRRANKFILSITGSIILVLLIVALVIYPQAAAIIGINLQINQEKVSLEKKISLGINVKQVKASLEQIESSIGNLNQMFIKPGEEIDFLNLLDRLGSQRQLTLSVIPDFNGKKINSALRSIPLEISATGPYSDIYGFIHDLEAMPYYYDIDQVQLMTQNNNRISVKLIGQTYMRDNK
ncbi:MAG: type 4a pilus biogenesis protein PilO [Patescibacteria group bacterium]